MKIAFIPIDNRPVCYTLAQQIADIDEELELLLPPREMLGDLKKIANIHGLLQWLKDLPQIDKAIISLDTIAHGGLIPSRRSVETFEEIKSRLEQLWNILLIKNTKVFAFSSIMRISNNNINEEEKEYWNLYGEKIFQYSYNSHKIAPEIFENKEIPDNILQDYLQTRKRNFDLNKYYLEVMQTENTKEIFDTLVFSKDDCAQYGFNVAEAQNLQQIINKTNVNAFVKTGADEIPLSLLSRAITQNKNIKIAPIFTNPSYTNKISKYEDVSVFDSVKGQIELAGATIANETNADIILLVNNFKDEQGELVMGVDVEGTQKDFEFPQKPYIIADILNANGSDNCFVKNLFSKDFNKNFLGYAGWNTTGNTLGSALCCGLTKYLSKKTNENAFKKVQFVRFADDWAYQANVRKELKSYLTEISTSELKTQMTPYEKILNNVLNTSYNSINYSYPWQRFFEIEVTPK